MSGVARLLLAGASWRQQQQQQALLFTSRHYSDVVLPWPALMQAAITPKVCAALKTEGFAIVDGALPPDVCAALHAEIDALRAAPEGLTRPNHTFFVPAGGGGGGGSGPRLVEKRAIVEAEISHDPRTHAAAPLLAQIDADATLATLLSLHLPPLRLSSGAGGSQGIKAQFNAGGGAFPIHTDSEDDARAVTAVFYLNAGWRPEHGGQLRLYPFPRRAPLDVAPLEGRLALFSSKQMHHRVLPAAAPRYCFTVWLSEVAAAPKPGAAAASRPKPPPPVGDGDGDGDAAAAAAAVRAFLVHPAVRRHVVRIAYASEWAESLADAHAPGAGADAAAAQHIGAAAAAARALAPYVDQIRQLAEAAASAPGGAEGAGLLPPGAVRWF